MLISGGVVLMLRLLRSETVKEATAEESRSGVMGEVREFVVFTFLGLMLAVACLLIVSGSLLVAWVGTDWEEGAGLFAVAGIVCVVVGAVLTCGAIFLARRRVRLRRGRAVSDGAGVVQASPMEAETPQG